MRGRRSLRAPAAILPVWLALVAGVPAPAVAATAPASPSEAPAGQARPSPSPKAPVVSADSAILVETSTGDVLYARRPDRPRLIASATKLMTALVVLEQARLSEVLPASRYRPAPVESQLGLAVGEELTVADLMRGLLLESANDAAVTLAEGVSGSRPAFVRAMNARARELGLTRTRFTNPIGLDARGNRSTARDLVRLTLKLRTFPFFRRTVARESVTLASGATPREIENRNSLVGRPRIDGVKTGHTEEAGYVLVGSGRSPLGVRLISVVLGEPSIAARNQDTLALLDYGFRSYVITRPVKRSERYPDARIPIRYRRGAELPLMPERTLRLVSRRGEAPPEVSVVGVPSIVEGPVRRGRPVEQARLRITRDGRVLDEVPLVAAATVPAADLSQRVKDWLTRPYALALLLFIAGFGVLLVRFVTRRRRSHDLPPRGAEVA